MDLVQSVNYYLEPGYIYFTRRPASVRAVVGSCVAVCLWDRALKYGGMNHFLMPKTRQADDATPKYGNVACAALIQMMEEAGCDRSNLVAQVLGGASPEGAPRPTLGDENVAMAREVLGRKGVTVVSEDVGGSMGRKLVFDTGTGQLVVLKVHKLRQEDWLS